MAQPVQALKGFRRLHLAPAEDGEVAIALGPDELALVNRDLRHVVEPGTFRIMVGASSRDIRLRGALAVHP